MSLDHYLGWNHDSIKRYFVKNPAYEGQELLVAEPYYGKPTFWLVKVINPDFGRYHKIQVNYRFGWHSKSDLFQRSGKHNNEPTGVLQLLPYNDKIAKMIRAQTGNPKNCIRFTYEESKAIDISGPGEYDMKED